MEKKSTCQSNCYTCDCKTLVIHINWKNHHRWLVWMNTGGIEFDFSMLLEYKKLYIEGKFAKVLLCDWEPLNHTRIFDILEYLLDFTSTIIIETNGERLSDKAFLKKIETIFWWNKVIFILSLYGWSRKIHNLISWWNYDKVLLWLYNVKSSRLFSRVRVFYYILKQNFQEVHMAQKLIGSFGFELKLKYSIPETKAPLEKILLRFWELENIYWENIYIEWLPKCKQPQYIKEKKIKQKITLYQWKTKEIISWISSNRLEKVYVDICTNCEKRKECSGIFQKYLHTFWEGEFLYTSFE